MQKHIISKERVANHGEVYTQKREVDAMLDLVRQETERIESRFLEPACGTGNFLAPVLERKLEIVKNRYKKNQLEFEQYAVLAVSSIYGIDILQDNVQACRERLFTIFNKEYCSLYKQAIKIDCQHAVQYILERNIIWGDALKMQTVNKPSQSIVFSEWSPTNGGSMLKRRDFKFSKLIPGFLPQPRELFPQEDLFSDLDEDVFIPDPVKEYPLVHFLRITDVQ